MVRSNLITFGCAMSLIATLAATVLGQETKPRGAQPVVGTAAAHSPQQRPTLENLQTAFFAESNASAYYVQYAKKADAEGYGQLASMFRAIARGEEIHAANCAALIKQMGQTPKVIDEPLIVLSTAENLDAADATQIYEKDVMYPEYIKQARRENNKTAAEVFRRNMAAEPAHHALIEQARKDIDGYKGEHITFLVCSTCGYAVRAMNAPVCPLCSTAKERFEQVK